MFCSDGDGCLNGLGGPTVPWDLIGMKMLKDKLSRVKDKAPDWIFSIITGRSEDWLLALIEALAIAEFWPDVYIGAENGAIAHRLGDWKACMHPGLTNKVDDDFKKIDDIVIPELVKLGGIIEPKRTCRTVTAPKRMSSAELAKIAESICESNNIETSEIKTIYGASAVDFVVVNKEDGLRHIAHLNDVNLSNVCVVGDGGADLDMAMIAGNSGAPANASFKVKVGMKMVAKLSGPCGVIQIIEAAVFNNYDGVVINK